MALVLTGPGSLVLRMGAWGSPSKKALDDAILKDVWARQRRAVMEEVVVVVKDEDARARAAGRNVNAARRAGMASL